MRIDRDRAREMFGVARVARLATTDGRGHPHLVPVTFVLEEEHIAIPVDHKPKRTTALKRLSNIRQNPEVSLLADHYDDDWSRLWWVRADGRAENEQARDHPATVRALAEKYRQYRTRPPEATLILVRVRRFSGWSASGD